MTRRYLLVDDNRDFAENLAEILTDHGAEVVQANDGATALAALGQGPYDVMITDMRMPGISGAELLRQVRERDAGLPVVLVSAYTRNEQLEEAHRLGLLAFVGKTSSTGKLLELLERARRDAVVFALCDDVRIERAREALAQVGVTVCTLRTKDDLDAHPAPLAAICDCVDDPLLDAVRARYPNMRVVKCAEAAEIAHEFEPAPTGH